MILFRNLNVKKTPPNFFVAPLIILCLQVSAIELELLLPAFVAGAAPIMVEVEEVLP